MTIRAVRKAWILEVFRPAWRRRATDADLATHVQANRKTGLKTKATVHSPADIVDAMKHHLVLSHATVRIVELSCERGAFPMPRRNSVPVTTRQLMERQ